MTYRKTGQIPVGGIVAFAKSLTVSGTPVTPALPPEFVECNGQTLSDAQSVYDGRTIPNLINYSGGQPKRFLRGSATSGGTGGTLCHTHTRSNTTGDFNQVSGMWAATLLDNAPSFYQVVWVMRVK